MGQGCIRQSFLHSPVRPWGEYRHLMKVGAKPRPELAPFALSLRTLRRSWNERHPFESRPMTQERLAEELGVDVRSVRDWEGGRRAPRTAERLGKICDVLDAPREALALSLTTTGQWVRPTLASSTFDTTEIVVDSQGRLWRSSTGGQVLLGRVSPRVAPHITAELDLPPMSSAAITANPIEAYVSHEHMSLSASASSAATVGRGHFSSPIIGSVVNGVTRREHVGAAHVRQVERTVASLYAQDLQFGGADLSDRGQALLRWAYRLMEKGACRPDIEQSPRSAVGNLSLCLGWLVFDAGRHAEASGLYNEALLIARLAGDPLLETHVFSSMSHQATTLGLTRRAVACAQAAQEVARGTATPRVESLLALREARAWAASGESATFEDIRRRACDSFEQGCRDDDPHWIKFLDEADFAGHVGRCYADLHQDARAEHLFRQAFDDLWDSPYQRNRAAWSLRLACALARQRKLDEACDIGSQILDVVVGLGSQRILQQVRGLWLHLQGFWDVPMVRDLGERIDAVLRGPATEKT
jgi:transcriptional regulator with XRE-family HTH domain/tetratricopeptide (TPR) repeat protein